MMEPDKKINKAVDDRIRKEREAWITLRRTLISNNNIDKKLKICLFDSLIGSILLYGLSQCEINPTQIKKCNHFTPDVLDSSYTEDMKTKKSQWEITLS